MTDDHSAIAYIKDFAKDPSQATEEGLRSRFMNMDDGARTVFLQTAKQWFDGDNTNSLRQKSQLWQLTRDLEVTHKNLRKIGR